MNAERLSIRRIFLPILSALLISCRPGADFKVSVRVIDEATGKPISDAWVLAAVAVKVEPAREPPYNRAVAGTRAKTDRRGIAVFNQIEGIYWGEEPQDKLWLMLESRKPKVKRRITLMKEGDLFVFAKDFGALHHPFHFKGTPQEHAGMGPFGIKGEDNAIVLDPAELRSGAVLTVTMSKPDKEYLYGSFHPDTFLPAIWAATSKKTGASKSEKRAIYDFFVRNLAPLDRDRPEGADRGHIKPEALLEPEVIERFVNHAPSRNQGTAVQEWTAQKALELLPPGYEEVKEYAQEILAGVREEEEGDRPLNHYYNPSDPDKAMPGGETALKWGAIGYPDNPKNEWDWEDALRYYRAGEKARAYRALGHVAHLLADMAGPQSTTLDPALTAGLDTEARGTMQPAGGPAFARTPRQRFEAIAIRSHEGEFAMAPSAAAQMAGLFFDFNMRLHPPAFVAAPEDGDGHGLGQAQQASKGDATDAGGHGPRKKPARWVEIEHALRILPRRSGRGVRYYVLDQMRGELRGRIDKVKLKGDIIPPILERLAREPKTEEDEAEIFNLVYILKEEEDERALPVLERLAKSAPPTTFSMMDEGTQHRYPYHHLAQETLRMMQIHRAAAQWEVELRPFSRKERIERLADVVWLGVSPQKDLDARGAGKMLRKECPTSACQVELILARIPRASSETNEGRRALIRMARELAEFYVRGLRDNRIKRAVADIQSKEETGELRTWADYSMRQIEKAERLPR